MSNLYNRIINIELSLIQNNNDLYSIKRILRKRIIDTNKFFNLIKWEGYNNEYNV